MNPSRRTNLTKWTAVLGACAAICATSAQAGGPPADPGWAGVPHCTVPKIEGKQLAPARKTLRNSLCGVMAPLRKRSAAARNTVLTAIPAEGTILAPRHESTVDRRQVIKEAALLGAVAAVIVPTASPRMLDPGPPEDPGIAGLPHCTVPGVRGIQLAAAKHRVLAARCSVSAVMRRRSSVHKGRVVSVVPRAGTVLAEGTGVVLFVSAG